MPSSATMSEPVPMAEGSATHFGRPPTRAAKPDQRSSSCVRPLRWPKPSTKRRVVATIAPAVAPMTSPIAAPPAGSTAAVKVVMSLCITV
jgi:hypothetical protein